MITEGKKGTELQTAIQRLEKERGVVTIRSDTGTARSIDYNAERIEEAVCQAVELKKPYGLVGYSQGCANGLNFESTMLSGEFIWFFQCAGIIKCLSYHYSRHSRSKGAPDVVRMRPRLSSVIVLGGKWLRSRSCDGK